MTKINPERAWCVVYPDGDLAVGSVFKSSAASKRAHARQMSLTWEYLEKRGYRCIPVMITPVEEEE